MAIEPLQPRSLVDRVEERLLTHLSQALRQPEARLPAEPELARELGVSRPVLREALSRLHLVGLVRSRPRVGLVAGEPDPYVGLSRVLALQPAGVQAAELADLRVLLEQGIADRLFDRIGLEDLVQLEAIVQDEASDPFDRERLRACDRAFHSCLYRAIGNEALRRQLGLLAAHFDEQRYRSDQLPDPPRVGHADLLDILRGGTPARWRTAIAEHLGVAGDKGTARHRRR